jgi:hypothetical protein
MADNSFLMGAKGIDVPNPLDMAVKGLTLGQLYNQNQMSDINLKQQRDYIEGFKNPSVSQAYAKAYGGDMTGVAELDPNIFGSAAPLFQKSMQELALQGSQIAKNRAETGKTNQETLDAKLGEIANKAGFLRDHPNDPNALYSLIRQTQFLGLDPNMAAPVPVPQSAGSASSMMQSATGGPDANAAAVKAYAEAWQSFAVKPETRQAMQISAAKFGPEMVGLNLSNSKTAQDIQFKPQEVNIAQQTANTGSMNAQTSRMDLVQPKTSESPFGTVFQTNRFGVPGQQGFGKLGTEPSITMPPGNQLPSGGAIDIIAKGIGAGKLPPPARTSPLAETTMARVLQGTPGYDATAYENKAKTVERFGSADLGQSVTALNVAVSHLDTGLKLFEALKNGRITLVNEYGNKLAQQTGQPAITSFEAAKQVIANEVVKAMVANGSSDADRERAVSAIQSQSSPAQMLGVVRTYQSLFAGKLGGLKQQYEVNTKLQDFNDKLTPETKAILDRMSEAAPEAPVGGGKLRRRPDGSFDYVPGN